jgi:LPPG:FO 2-phospho-L-lactate transferase
VIVVLAGGVGAARFLQGLVDVVDADEVTVVGNVGDDTTLHGLHISPDLDTVTYTLAGVIDPHNGWGVRDDTWQAMEALERFGVETWFRLGDRDLATHLFRTERLAAGVPLSEVTAEIALAFGLEVTLLPVTDDPLRTWLELVDGTEIPFQDYFVKRRHADAVRSVRFAGAEHAKPAPGVLEALDDARAIVLAPSNPIVSIDPVLSVPGMRETLMERRDSVVAISPIIGGKALKGPADRLLRELGEDASALGVARHHASVAGTIVIDAVDGELVDAIEAVGVRAVVTDTVMRDRTVRAELARTVLDAAR